MEVYFAPSAEDDEEDAIVEQLAAVLESSSGIGGSGDNNSAELAISKKEVLGRLSLAVRAYDSVETPSKDVVHKKGRSPYQVWKERNSGPRRLAPRGPEDELRSEGGSRRKVFKEADWDQMVARLYASNRRREAAVVEKQHRNLSEELRDLKFQPKLCPRSLRLNAERKRSTMLDMQQASRRRKEAKMLETRQREIEAEMEECTFKPDLSATDTKSAKYLRRQSSSSSSAINKETTMRTTADMLAYAEQTQARRAQRKQIIDDLEARELTFSPTLNRKSLQMTKRLRKQGRIAVDPISRQTMPTTPLSPAHATTNYDESTTNRKQHTPTISARAKRYAAKQRGDQDVYHRLYSMAQQQVTQQHNDCVTRLKTYVAMPDSALKSWEKTPRDQPAGVARAPWLPPTPSKLIPHKWAHTFSLLEYSPQLDDFLEVLTNALTHSPPQQSTSAAISTAITSNSTMTPHTKATSLHKKASTKLQSRSVLNSHTQGPVGAQSSPDQVDDPPTSVFMASAPPATAAIPNVSNMKSLSSVTSSSAISNANLNAAARILDD